MTSAARHSDAGALAVRGLGALFLLVGLVLGVGGLWLAFRGGSLYYVIAGLSIAASGWYFLRLQLTGFWIYLILFAITLLWALSESGLDGWALMPRLLGPTLFLALALASLRVVAPHFSKRAHLGAWAGFATLIVVLASAIFVANRPAAPGPLPMLGGSSAHATANDWPAYGGTYAAQRYSTLDQISPDNVEQLQRVWVAHTGDLPDDMHDNSYGAETTPLKIGDTLYLCSAMNVVIALDAATGEERWRYDPAVPDDAIPYTAACRGVTYYSPATPDASGCGARVIVGTLDARLVSVDAETGHPCAGFGSAGAVDIKQGMGETTPGYVSITSPPVIVRDVVVTGHQVLDGQNRYAPSGVIQGFDVATGELRWGWDMAQPELTGRPEGDNTWTRGTPNMWTTATADEDLGLVYLPLGVTAADYWSGSRTPAGNEYATSLVALDVTTGKPAWHFQTVRKDVWDYDLGSQATLVDIPTGDGVTPALVLPSKQGDIYVLDRRTGVPLTEVGELEVPQGGVEPDERTATQPVSLYHTLRKPDLHESDMWGMSLIDQMLCRIQFREAAYDGFYTPPTADRRYIQYPGYNGGSDWGGVAIDPVRGVIIANYNDMPNYNRLVPREEADRMGWAPRGEARGGDMSGGAEGAGDPQANTPYAIDVNAGWRMPVTQLLCKQPPYGGIRAISLETGETIWDRPFGSARRNGPFGIPSGLPLNIGTPNNGGPIVTAGGLIFIAATTDNMFRAIDLATGETLWEDTLPAGGQATPMTFEIEGKQYVVIMAGGHHFMETPIGDSLVAYALPDA